MKPKRHAPIGRRSLPWNWAGWTLGAVLLLAYYLYQAPPDFRSWGNALDLSRFPSPPLGEMARRLGSLARVGATGLGIFLLTLGLGGRLGKWFGLRYANPWLEAAWKIILGIATLQLFWLGTGFCGLWRTNLLGPALLIALVATIRDARTVSKSPGRRDFRGEPFGLVLALGVTVLGLALAFVPETFFDSLVYILAVPDEWLRAGGVTPHLGQSHEWFYLGASTWFANGLFLQGAEAAKFQAALLAPIAALFAGGWAWDLTGEFRSAIWTACLTVLIPQLALNSWAARSDVLTALALLGTFYALQRGSEGGRWNLPWLAASGTAFGLAISTKYLAALALPALGWMLARNRVRLRGTWAWGLVAVPVLVFVGPWTVRNLAFTGNPLYPYLPGVFGGLRLPDWGLARLLYENKLTPFSWFSWPPVPWRLVMPGYDLSQPIGPWVLVLTPFLFLIRFPRKVQGTLLASAAVLLGLGLLLTPSLRFHLGAFLLLAVVLGSALGALPAGSIPDRAARWVFRACLLVAAVLCVNVAAQRFDPVGVWSLRESRDAYLQRTISNPYLPLAAWAREKVPRDGRLLWVGDSRGLYLPGEVLRNSVDDEPFLAQAAQEDWTLGDFARRLKRNNITHLGVNLAEGLGTAPDYGHYSRLSPEERERLKAWCGQTLRLVRQAGSLSLYEVAAAPFPPGQPGELLPLDRLIDAGSEGAPKEKP